MHPLHSEWSERIYMNKPQIKFTIGQIIIFFGIWIFFEFPLNLDEFNFSETLRGSNHGPFHLHFRSRSVLVSSTHNYGATMI